MATVSCGFFLVHPFRSRFYLSRLLKSYSTRMNGSSENKHISSSHSLFLSERTWGRLCRCLPAIGIFLLRGDLPHVVCKQRLRSARAVSIFVLGCRCSVGVVAAAGTTTATVTTTVASTSGRVATRGATIAAAHGRSAVASIWATTTARAAATTTTSAAVHAREVRSLGDDL
jgi:hypothetical protein